jgi:hypothetical protein
MPVRVSAWFWVAAALLGWNVCQALAGSDQRELLRLLVAWVAVVFVSLLVHELGHAFTYRWFGQSAHVVLYHFGGLAIPDAWGRRGARRPLERLLVSAAGPLAQLLFAAAVVAGLKAAGFRVPLPLPGLGDALGRRHALHHGERLLHSVCHPHGVAHLGRERLQHALQLAHS